MLDREHEYHIMSEVEDKHWWYKSLHEQINQSIRNIYGEKKDLAILDAGCGTGGCLKYLEQKGFSRLKGFDLSATAVKLCREKNLEVIPGDLRDIGRNFPGDSADIIISNDNLYFLNPEEIKEVLKSFYKIIKKDGLIIINVPALDILGGIHDKAVGINKRFSKKGLLALIDQNDYKLVKMVYWPFFLVPIILFTRIFQKLKLKYQKDVAIKSDLTLLPPPINEFLYFITRFENKLIPFKPLGSSLFVLLKPLK